MKNLGTKKYLYIVLLVVFGISLVFKFYSNRTLASQGNILSDPNNISTGQGVDSISSRAIEYYLENTDEEVNPEDVEVKKQNFGCHFEFHIYTNGELVMRLAYSGGRFYEV